MICLTGRLNSPVFAKADSFCKCRAFVVNMMLCVLNYFIILFYTIEYLLQKDVMKKCILNFNE